jgi:hypothetical protein
MGSSANWNAREAKRPISGLCDPRWQVSFAAWNAQRSSDRPEGGMSGPEGSE